jgi:5-(carboxyamino)imidazole ribonucleotide mutase
LHSRLQQQQQPYTIQKKDEGKAETNIKLNELPPHTGIDLKKPLVAIAAPSAKLLDEIKDTKSVLDSFGVLSEITIVAAHRSPKKTLRFIEQIESKGVDVVIAAGNGSAHLPGMIASLTTIPVIGVPLRSNFQDGMDSLLSIVQMPYGVPVATMGINSSYNAGIFACQILTLKYPYLREKIRIHKETLEQEVESEDREVKNRVMNSHEN